MTSKISNSVSRMRRASRGASRLLSIGCVATLAVMATVGMIRIRAQDSFPLPSVNPPGAKATAPANDTPPAQASGQPSGPTVNPNEPAVARQCADLLKMAAELKTEVDKTSRDTLSVAVVRKASEIEQFAHKVRTAANNHAANAGSQ